jgi:PET assembly of cytochrome c oxidase, mitochondrial
MHRVVMAVTAAGVVVIIVGVHIQQTAERAEMHKGVLHDKERAKIKKQNQKLQREAEKAAQKADQ